MAIEALALEQRLDPETGITSLKATGPVTLKTLFEFQDALRQLDGPKVLIDLSGVPYMDSAGLGAILTFDASAQRHGKRYAITGMAPRILVMFQVSKVDQFLSLYPTVADGEAALR